MAGSWPKSQVQVESNRLKSTVTAGKSTRTLTDADRALCLDAIDLALGYLSVTILESLVVHGSDKLPPIVARLKASAAAFESLRDRLAAK